MANTKERLREFLKTMSLDQAQLRLAFKGIKMMDDAEVLAILEDMEDAVMSLPEALKMLEEGLEKHEKD